MDVELYTDFSITSATYLTKYAGVWLPRNESEARQRKISISYMAVALLYALYVNAVDIYHSWGDATVSVSEPGCVIRKTILI